MMMLEMMMIMTLTMTVRRDRQMRSKITQRKNRVINPNFTFADSATREEEFESLNCILDCELVLYNYDFHSCFTPLLKLG
jgi:hypothetical protein